MKEVLIVGAGFAGLAAALKFSKLKMAGLKIRLVSDKPHFEYSPALYRVVTGRSPLNVCIPIAEVLGAREIEFVEDKIVKVNPAEGLALGQSGSRYRFDYLVLALGSETAYFGLTGVEKFSLGFKSISQAIRIKNHLHNLLEQCKKIPAGSGSGLNIVVVGAGSSGVELAGELAVYLRRLASEHGVSASLISIDLFEAASRILPTFSPALSERVGERLRELGVNIFTSRPIIRQDLEEVELKGMTIESKTVIWTAGIRPNQLYSQIEGFVFDERGRVIVDEYLRSQGFKNIFVAGDGAATPYSGLAQTAVRDGKLAACNVSADLLGQPLLAYQPVKPYHSIPVGPGWAATVFPSGATIYGYAGWFLRRLADLRYFLSILPPAKAILAFRSGSRLCETCKICEVKDELD